MRCPFAHDPKRAAVVHTSTNFKFLSCFFASTAVAFATLHLVGCESPKNDGGKPTSLDRPLYNAALKGDTNVVKALLDKGANPNATFWTGAPAGETSVHAAARRRNIETLKMLVDHGGNLFKEGPGFGVPYLTPFEASVTAIEAPGLVTDMFIEEGAKPKKNGAAPVATAGTYWAMAVFKEQHGDFETAVECYKIAAEWYQKSSRKALGDARWSKFMGSPLFGSFLVGSTRAFKDAGFKSPYYNLDPITVDKIVSDSSAKNQFDVWQDKAERDAARYVIYSTLCADRAKELIKTDKP